MIAARISAIAGNTIVISVIIWRTHKSYNHNGVFETSRGISGLPSVVLAHGVWYFLSLSILNILEIVLNHLYPRWVGPMVSFALPISSVLGSRFLLDIGEAAQQEDSVDCHDSLNEPHILTKGESIQFAISSEFVMDLSVSEFHPYECEGLYQVSTSTNTPIRKIAGSIKEAHGNALMSLT